MNDLNTAELERLIGSADARETELWATIKSIGTERITRVLAEEIVFRADRAEVHRPYEVGLDITGASEPIHYVFRVLPDGQIEFSEGVSERAVHVIGYDCADLVRDIFGTATTPKPVRRVVRSRFEEAFEPESDQHLLASPLYAQRATAAVLSGIEAVTPDLGALSTRYLSDKWGGVHWFTPHYERHFAGLRYAQLRILDIGIGGFEGRSSGGGSLLMWRRFFPRAVIFGVDIFDKSGLDQPRIKTLRGDQNNAAWLADVGEKHGPFDIIIDDGSHVNDHVLGSFSVLFEKYLRIGGIYVIEDMWTAYCPGYGGDDSTIAGESTSIGMVKSLVDALHHEEHHAGATEATEGVGATVAGLHVYRNLAFIEKGMNVDGGIPAFIPRQALS